MTYYLTCIDGLLVRNGCPIKFFSYEAAKIWAELRSHEYLNIEVICSTETKFRRIKKLKKRNVYE